MVQVGNFVKILVELRAKETDEIIVPAGSVGIVDDIQMGFGGSYVDVIINDVHFSTHWRSVQVISEEEFRAAYAHRE